MSAIDWSGLCHAYGEASNVPRILSALASGEKGERDGGYYDFYGSLCHQGSVYSATLAAIPSLLELLREPSYPDRLRLLAALTSLAHASGEGVEMGEIRAALAHAADDLLRIVQQGPLAEKSHALSIFAGPEFARTAARLVDLAHPNRGLSPALRSRAWEAVSAVASDLVPDEVVDEPAVALAAVLCRLEAAGEAAPNALVEKVWRALSNRDAVTRLKTWAKEAGGPSPFEHCRVHLRGESPRLLAKFCAELIDTHDEGEPALALARLLLETAFAECDPRDPTARDVDLAQLTPKQREVLAALVEADSAWSRDGGNNGDLLFELMMRGLPFGVEARDELRAALGVARRRRMTVVVPHQVRGARERIATLGREAWLDVPFVFVTAGGEEVNLDDAIPEDAAAFTPEVMNDFREIEKPLRAMVIRYTCPVSSVRFYPDHDATTFADLARTLGVELVPPNLTFAEDPYDTERYFAAEDAGKEAATTNNAMAEVEAQASEAAAPPPCLVYSALSDEVKERLEAFVACFDGAGFVEVSPSYAFSRTMGEAGMCVSPLAVARRFGQETDIEIDFHCDEESGAFLRARLVSKADGENLVLRFPVLSDAIFAAFAGIDVSKAPAVALRPIGSLREPMLVEFEGKLLEMTLDE